MQSIEILKMYIVVCQEYILREVDVQHLEKMF